MNLRNKKQLVARMLEVSPKRVWVDNTRAQEVKEAITRDDIKNLMKNGVIALKQKKGVSRSRARVNLVQKRKGRRQGAGSRKGVMTARLPSKEAWKQRIRAIRSLINLLKEKELITKETYKELRVKAKGGYFRSQRHIKLYLTEHKLWLTKNGKK